jgi:hypothetical protein
MVNGRCFRVLTIDHLPLTIYESEQLCQILSDDIQKLDAANAAPTMLCEFRRQPSVRIARSPACNIASARSVDTTRTGRWCG